MKQSWDFNCLNHQGFAHVLSLEVLLAAVSPLWNPLSLFSPRESCCALALLQCHFRGAGRIPFAPQSSPRVLPLPSAGSFSCRHLSYIRDSPSPAVTAVFFCPWNESSAEQIWKDWPISVASAKCVLGTISCSTISAFTPLTGLVSHGTFLINRECE